MSTTTTATTVNSNEKTDNKWGYVSDTNSELGSELGSEQVSDYQLSHDQKIKLALSRLKAAVKNHLLTRFRNNKYTPFFSGHGQKMTDENLHFLLEMLLRSYSQLVIHDNAVFTKLNKVYLNTICGAGVGTFPEQIASAIDIFNSFLPREFYFITNVCLFQNNDGYTYIVIGIDGYEPVSSLTNGYKLVYHIYMDDKNTWTKSEYRLHEMVQIASPFKEEKKTETHAMDKPKTSVMKSRVAPLDAWNRSETTDASSKGQETPWKKSEVVSDTMSDTTQTTQPLPNMAPKSGPPDMDFDTFVEYLKTSNFEMKQYERLRAVVNAKIAELEAKKALEEL
jgi:hypothetical protein